MTISHFVDAPLFGFVKNSVRGFPARRGSGAWLEPPKGLGMNRQFSIDLKIHAEASIS
jgi:hypothetical protein